MNISDTGYISLNEATKYCNYSQDYLKLRARQGKLKAIKIGRNWVTTREWIREYLDSNYAVSNHAVACFSDGVSGWRKVLEFKLIILILGLGLITFLFFSLIGPEYFQWLDSQTKSFLASPSGIIPSRVIEIK